MKKDLFGEYYSQLVDDLKEEFIEEKHRLKTTSCRLFHKGVWVNCESDNIKDNPFDLFSCEFR